MLKTLLEAKARIERGWTQGAFARSKTGSPIAPRVPDACSWCLEGALWADSKAGVDAVYLLLFLVNNRKLFKRASSAQFMSLDRWNDDSKRTQAQVIQLLDMAITLLDTHRVGVNQNTGEVYVWPLDA